MAITGKIAVYSPVPGSGASTLASVIAEYLVAQWGCSVSLVNCDILYPDRQYVGIEALEGPVNVFLPSIDRGKCVLCKACARACVFHAIRIEKSIGWISLETNRCRACGACLNTCRYDAIGERVRAVGSWRIRKVGQKLTVIKGKLQAEDFFAIHVIQQIKAKAANAGITVFDAFSGVNHPALESLHGADMVILVIDPALADKSYFDHAVGIVSRYNHRMAAVINKSGPGQPDIGSFLQAPGLPVIATIPRFNAPDALLNADKELLQESLQDISGFIEEYLQHRP